MVSKVANAYNVYFSFGFFLFMYVFGILCLFWFGLVSLFVCFVFDIVFWFGFLMVFWGREACLKTLFFNLWVGSVYI